MLTHLYTPCSPPEDKVSPPHLSERPPKTMPPTKTPAM